MKYPEEDYAKDLFRELSQRFTPTTPATSVTVEGEGVHWRCIAQRGGLRCRISCFDERGPEYYTSFDRDSNQIATSRIPSKHGTIDAVADWLDGRELSFLYEYYPFVDFTKRSLSRIRDDVMAAAPELQRLSVCQLEQQLGDHYHLHFRADDRSCEIFYYGKNKLPDAKFSWDDCQLFQFQPDDSAGLAAVLKSWLIDHSMPSIMRKEFPWIKIDDLADYYESGNPIEGEFIGSWNRMERFYDDIDRPFAPKVKSFLVAMRKNGYDKSLRAGQSMWSLILSRSRRHRLRPEQPSVQFWFRNDGMDVHDFVADSKNENKFVMSEIKLTPEVDRILRQLLAAPID